MTTLFLKMFKSESANYEFIALIADKLQLQLKGSNVAQF